MTPFEFLIYWVIGFIFVMSIVFILIMFFKIFKHRIVIKELANEGRGTILFKRAKEYKDKDGITWWRLFNEKDKEKKLVPVPPPEAIELTNKGKKVVHCYRTQEGEYIFVKDRGLIEPYPIKMLQNYPKKYDEVQNKEERDYAIAKWKQETLKEWMEKNNIQATYQPLKTQHRMLLVNNYRRAEERKKSNWLLTNMPAVVGLGMLLIVMISIFLFAGEFAQPFMDKEQITLQQMEVMNENLKVLKEIKYGVQSIGGQTQIPPEGAPD